MDFFEHQEVARRNTGRLVVLFALAVIGIVALVYFAALFAFGFLQTEPQGAAPSLFQPGLLAITAAAVLLVVGVGSAFKTVSLRGGGSVVAESLGGRRIEPGSSGPRERVLLNVVEEMAIASGTPVPPVYVMEREQGINAFAAGHSPSDAVLGFTRGSVERLSRDELQGVVAHEFSHVFNGDMRLNLRLMGVVHGILLIGLIGETVLRSGLYAGGLGSRRRDRGGSGGVLVFGIALAAIGWVGTFFGSLIKSGVSRQREFLADASAVQYTRNPSGIAGALQKIGGLVHGSRLVQPNASEVSHMLFGQGFRTGLTSLFATHPPLEERVRRIDPSFDGRFPRLADQAPAAADRRAETPPASSSLAGAAPSRLAAEAPAPRDALSGIGQPTAEHLEHARQLVASLPEAVREAALEPYGARAVIFALLLDPAPDVRASQLSRLEQRADAALQGAVRTLAPLVDALGHESRLPAIDLALPALRELSPAQYAEFRELVDALVRADERIDVFEWVLERILVRHLDPNFAPQGARRKAVQYYGLQRLGGPVSALLSTLARVGHESEDEAARAFGSGADVLRVPSLGFQPRGQCGLRALETALAALELVAPKLKRQLLEACARTIAFDREITVLEGELFRAVADSLDCPVPPLLPGQRLA